MWIVTKTFVLTLVSWALATLAFAFVAYLALGLVAGRLGMAPPVYLECLGAFATLVTVVAAVRFAFSAPLVTHDRNTYGNPEFMTIQWPPPPEPTRVSQDVRVPGEMSVRLPSSEVRVRLTGGS